MIWEQKRLWSENDLGFYAKSYRCRGTHPGLLLECRVDMDTLLDPVTLDEIFFNEDYD